MRRQGLTLAIACAATLLLGSAAPVSAGPAPSGEGFDLDAATIPDLQRRMSHGQLSAVGLTDKYLARIDRLDPTLGAVLALDPTAREQAAESDRRRRAGSLRGPLDGIPVLVKDNVDTAGLASTAGSRALLGTPPVRDAALVGRLRDAGAVLIGKTNMSEWANFRAEKPTSGWSAVRGHTRNPYVLDRNPCGSSSGSAVGVASSLAQVAIGSETDGSIVCPAGMTGVVGHKPTLGLVSGQGVVPISAEQDTAGPMGRHVVDVALTLSAISEPGLATAMGSSSGASPSMAGTRMGLWRIPSLGPEVDALVTRTADTLRANGATVVEVELPYQDKLAELEFPALLTEFRRDLNDYLANRPGAPADLAALIAYNSADPLERTCFEGQELFTAAEVAPGPDDPEYRRMRAELTDLSRRSIDETMAAHQLDVIAAPANPPAWTTDCARGDDDVIPSSTPAAVAGYPSAAVPAGFVGELPVGLLLTGQRSSDARILGFAAGVERILGARRPPGYLPTTG